MRNARPRHARVYVRNVEHLIACIADTPNGERAARRRFREIAYHATKRSGPTDAAPAKQQFNVYLPPELILRAKYRAWMTRLRFLNWLKEH